MPEYVVITREATATVTRKSRGPSNFRSDGRREEISVAKMDLPQSEEANLARDLNVVDFARNMPTRLIRPLEVASAGTAPAAGWGITAVGAATTRFTGRGVSVAVLDTGIDRSHPAFAGVDVVEEDFSGDGNGDVAGHGTHCAGTIFGRDVDGQRIGVAPGVEKALIAKVLGDGGGGDTQMMIDGLMWAAKQGANVISMSLGFDFPGMVQKLIRDEGWPEDMATTVALQAFRSNMRVLDEAMRYVKSQSEFGRHNLVIAASGNESRRQDSAQYRIAASPPSAAEGVIAVAAIGPQGDQFEIAPFSNSLPVMSAPGVGIVSAKAGGGLVALSGTSMACPHAAGVAALWWQWVAEAGGPRPSGTNVTAKLIGSVTREPLLAYNETDFGEGLVQAP